MIYYEVALLVSTITTSAANSYILLSNTLYCGYFVHIYTFQRGDW
jgi:hypothetical protein